MQVKHEAKTEVEQRVHDLVENARKELRRTSFRIYSFIAGTIIVSILIAYLSAQGTLPIEAMDYAVLLFIGPILVPTLLIGLAKRQNKALRKLATCEDIHALGPLLDIKGHVTDNNTKKAIYLTMTRLLLAIKTSDRSVLKDTQYKHLLQSIEGCQMAVTSAPKKLQFEPYYLAVLKATEQIGDEQALPRVEAIVKAKPKSAPARRIHQAAQECLMVLLTRIDQSGKRLLRPVGEPEDNHLLRPAGPGSESPEHQLVRSSSQDPN